MVVRVGKACALFHEGVRGRRSARGRRRVCRRGKKHAKRKSPRPKARSTRTVQKPLRALDATDRGASRARDRGGRSPRHRAGVWRFRGGFVVDARSAVESRAGSSAVAPRTVLEHLQQREGRDLDVLRGVHLRGIPGGRLGSAPHHTPATHHAGDVHRALFTCTWPCTAKWSCARKTRSVTSVARSIGTRCLGLFMLVTGFDRLQLVYKTSPNQLSLAPEKLTRRHRWSFPAALFAQSFASGSGTAQDVATRWSRRARAGHGCRRA